MGTQDDSEGSVLTLGNDRVRHSTKEGLVHSESYLSNRSSSTTNTKSLIDPQHLNNVNSPSSILIRTPPRTYIF